MDSPLKWHGGKGPLASKIVALMPPRCKNPNAPAAADPGWLHYVEPYCGGASVAINTPQEGISVVINDMNGELTNFWRVLQHPHLFQDFCRRAEATPFSKTEFERAVNEDKVEFYGAPVDRAWCFFIRCRQSLAGRKDTFASITRNRTRRGMNEQVAAWLNAVEGLPEVHAVVKRWLILNKPALEVIRKEDGPRTLFYLDPPYLHETRNTTSEYGEHEMSEKEHSDLLITLGAVKGRFLLSGYRSKMYDGAAADFGWKRHDFKVVCHAAGGKKKGSRVESVWMNY